MQDSTHAHTVSSSGLKQLATTVTHSDDGAKPIRGGRRFDSRNTTYANDLPESMKGETSLTEDEEAKLGEEDHCDRDQKAAQRGNHG